MHWKLRTRPRLGSISCTRSLATHRSSRRWLPRVGELLSARRPLHCILATLTCFLSGVFFTAGGLLIRDSPAPLPKDPVVTAANCIENEWQRKTKEDKRKKKGDRAARWLRREQHRGLDTEAAEEEEEQWYEGEEGGNVD